MAERGDEVAVVVPVHDNEATLLQVHAELAVALAPLDRPWHVWFVDDASTDGSWATIRSLASTDPRVSAVRLARNVGQTRAVCVGIQRASAAATIACFDADLDYDATDLAALVRSIDGPASLALGVRPRRHGPTAGRQVTSVGFNLVLAALLGPSSTDVGCGLFALDRALAAQLPEQGVRRLAIRPLLTDLSSRTVLVPVAHRPRTSSSMTSRDRARIAVELLAADGRPARRLASVATIGALATVAAPSRGVRCAGLGIAAATGAAAAALVRRRRTLAPPLLPDLGEVVDELG